MGTLSKRGLEEFGPDVKGTIGSFTSRIADSAQEITKRTKTLTIPELLFVSVTRAMLAAGVAFLVGQRLDRSTRRTLGTALLVIGVATTIPAVMMLARKHD